MNIGLRHNLIQTLRQTLSLRQIQRATVLEFDGMGLEEYLAEVVSKNPALRRLPSGRVRTTGPSERRFVPTPGEEGPRAEQFLTASADLTEDLWNQVRLERLSDAQRGAAQVLIFNLDQRGLLEVTLDEVAETTGCELEDVLAAQAKVMQMEPVGCGANDLYHYLTYMVGLRWPEDPFFADMIRDYLGPLRKRRFAYIGTEMEMDPEDVEEYLSMLQEVPPFPAQGYVDTTTNYVEPVIDVASEDGRWMVRLRQVPRQMVTLSEKFQRDVEKMPRGKDRTAAKALLDEARELVRSLNERKSLLERVAQLAVTHQEDWFEHGDDHMRNLTMKFVAEQVGCDRSHVSRVVQGVYFQWEKGVKPLRALFTVRRVRGGADVSEAQLHAILREIVENEDRTAPLSDSAISRILTRRGVKCARRTVNKHRVRIGIPSQAQRRGQEDD